MTTYSAVLSTEIDSDSPVTDTLMGKLANNPLAIAEGAAGAPNLSAGWLNYDGAATLTAIYDFGVHGAVATITSPDFEDGWEYQFWFDKLTHSGATTDDMSVLLYRETSAAYSASGILWTDFNTGGMNGSLIIDDPRAVKNFVTGTRRLNDGAATNTSFNELSDATSSNNVTGFMMMHTTAQKILRARFTVPATFNGGKIFMLRRQARAVI